MTATERQIHHTPQEYYRLEVLSDSKSEYSDGEILALPFVSPRHSLISANLVGELGNRLKGRRCTPYESNLRLKIQATGLITYPDASVYCDKLEMDPEDPARQTAVNPTVLFEVLSKSTEAYDRGKKAENYRQIAGLKAYLLIAQHEPHVELYERHGDGFWFLTEVSGMESEIAIPSLELSLPLVEIYDRVEFGEE